MSENSKIAWTTHTFNPWMGCTKVSPGCANCYAENLMDTRYGKVEWGPSGTRVKTSEANWRKPLKWDRDAETARKMNAQYFPGMEHERPRVFCASLADVFEDWSGPILNSKGETLNLAVTTNDRVIPPITLGDLRRDLFALIDATPNLDWLLLTKRPENIRRMWPIRTAPEIEQNYANGKYPEYFREIQRDFVSNRPNVWLGTTIESQEYESRWTEHLSKCRDLCGLTFISYEPALGPLDIRGWESVPDWEIFGGESDQGAKARECDVGWFYSGINQCRSRGVVPFVKQLGSNAYQMDFYGDPEVPGGTRSFPNYLGLKDKAGADPAEWPEDLRIRELPGAKP